MPRSFKVVLACFLAGGILVCVYLIGTQDLNPKECLLVGLLLTLLSIVASWLVSWLYSEATFNNSLRMYGLKAAEKVNNLSNELDRLSIFLQEELESTEYESKDHQLLAKQSRMEAAIHIIHTLKSVNDRSLSDWQGVIGEEIDAQREERKQYYEEEFIDLVDRVESLRAPQVEEVISAQDAKTAAILGQVESIKSELGLLAAKVGVAIRRPSASGNLEIPLEGTCPECGSTVRYRQRPKENHYKAVRCSTCSAKLAAHYQGGRCELTRRSPVPEDVECPLCQTCTTVSLDNFPGGNSATCVCDGCGLQLVVSRDRKGVKVRAATASDGSPLDARALEELVARVQPALPDQPWPKGTSKKVAEELRLPHSQVHRAIRELMRRGVFRPQIDGRLYVPVSNSPSTGKGEAPANPSPDGV